MPSDRPRWVMPALAAAAVLLWVAVSLWAARAVLPTLGAVALIEYLAALCAPPALVGIGWLLTQRTSRAEARRFTSTAAAMRAEAEMLEQRVASLSRTLAGQREQLVAQLDAGAAAAGRLDAIGRSMSAEIETADHHATNLATAAERARSTVGDLIAAMPLARTESEEVGRRLDQAGLAAAAQAAALDAQLAALDKRAREATTQTGAAADALATHLERMDDAGTAAGARLERVTGEVAGAVDALIARTERALVEARASLTQEGEALHAAVLANQSALQTAARDNVDALTTRLQTVDAAIDQVAVRLAEGRSEGERMVGQLSNGLAGVEQQLVTLHSQGVERTQLLAASISALGGSADAMNESLRTGEALATSTIATTEALLIALDSAAREIDETLPEALARLDARIGDSKQVVAQAKPELLALVTAAESTHDAIEAIAAVIAEQRSTLDQLSAGLIDTLTSGRTKADALGHMVDETIDRTQRFAEEAAPRLLDALLRVRDTAQVAADRARDTLASVIPDAADALEHAAANAMRRAASDTVARQVHAIGEASDAAVAAAARATERLAGHVQAIADQTALVDTRFEEAREAREAADTDTLARRVSLLIEALNSAAIDITKAMSPDVSDSAWAAYLKGDRGVFTRRAVRLLDGNNTREIVRLYDEDSHFREQVNRYIHDFEAMLRQVLAQRDGSPLGVTLLSSDMGKLYVALAQAIDRLR